MKTKSIKLIPPTPQPPANPPVPKPREPAVVYEYRLVGYTENNAQATFDRLGAEGWLFIASERSCMAVFVRAKA